HRPGARSGSTASQCAMTPSRVGSTTVAPAPATRPRQNGPYLANNSCVTKPTRTGEESSTASEASTAPLLRTSGLGACRPLAGSSVEALRLHVTEPCQKRLRQDQGCSLVEGLVAVTALGRKHAART